MLEKVGIRQHRSTRRINRLDGTFLSQDIRTQNRAGNIEADEERSRVWFLVVLQKGGFLILHKAHSGLGQGGSRFQKR